MKPRKLIPAKSLQQILQPKMHSLWQNHGPKRKYK